MHVSCKFFTVSLYLFPGELGQDQIPIFQYENVDGTQLGEYQNKVIAICKSIASTSKKYIVVFKSTAYEVWHCIEYVEGAKVLWEFIMYRQYESSPTEISTLPIWAFPI